MNADDLFRMINELKDNHGHDGSRVELFSLTPTEIEEINSLNASRTGLEQRKKEVEEEIEVFNCRMKLFFHHLRRNHVCKFVKCIHIDTEKFVAYTHD